MKKVALTFAAMILGTGVAAAAGSGNYLGDIANGAWGNNIQTTHQIAAPNTTVNNGNYTLALANGTWTNDVPTQYANTSAVQNGNTLRHLADGTWFSPFAIHKQVQVASANFEQ